MKTRQLELEKYLRELNQAFDLENGLTVEKGEAETDTIQRIQLAYSQYSASVEALTAFLSKDRKVKDDLTAQAKAGLAEARLGLFRIAEVYPQYLTHVDVRDKQIDIDIALAHTKQFLNQYPAHVAICDSLEMLTQLCRRRGAYAEGLYFCYMHCEILLKAPKEDEEIWRELNSLCSAAPSSKVKSSLFSEKPGIPKDLLKRIKELKKKKEMADSLIKREKLSPMATKPFSAPETKMEAVISLEARDGKEENKTIDWSRFFSCKSVMAESRLSAIPIHFPALKPLGETPPTP